MQTIQPPADLYAADDRHLLVVDLPGVSAEGLNLQVEDRVLTVEATPEVGTEAPTVSTGWGASRYKRAFTLSEQVDVDAITASLEAGVLRVELPHQAAMKPRRIEVSEA